MTGGGTNWIENKSFSVTGLAAKIQSSDDFRISRNLLVCPEGRLTQESICQRNDSKMVREIFGVKRLKAKEAGFGVYCFDGSSFPVPDQHQSLARLGFNGGITAVKLDGLTFYKEVHAIAQPELASELKNQVDAIHAHIRGAGVLSKRCDRAIRAVSVAR